VSPLEAKIHEGNHQQFSYTAPFSENNPFATLMLESGAALRLRRLLRQSKKNQTCGSSDSYYAAEL
jgi:hypothetical protein